MTEKLSPTQQELLSRADQIFASIAEAAKTTAEFAKDQIPDIAYQYVAFGRAYTTFSIILSILLFFSIFLAFKLAGKKSRQLKEAGVYDNDWPFVLASVYALIMLIISIGTFASNIKPLFLVWFVPKIWLITEVTSFLK